MWPFKKKHIAPVPKVAKTILCIPGNWKDFDDFNKSLIVSNGGTYMVIGEILMSVARQRHYTIEWCERDVNMKESFTVAGKVTRMKDTFLDEIGKHTYVIYITGETGSLEEAQHIAHAGNAILNAGGTGIKIESTGKAFEKSSWTETIENFEEHRLYEMFVLDSIINEDDTIYSCGMQNLGLKDTVVSGEDVQEAIDLIKIFGYYQLVDKPIINHNQTFQKDSASPVFRITNEPNPIYAGHETFDNPYGMWRLSRV